MLHALQGPNVNLNIKDYVNNSTTYKNKNELVVDNDIHGVKKV